MKKLFALILTVIMAAAMLSGCVLFERDTAAEMAQLVAIIDPIKMGHKYDPDYTTDYHEITKQQLVGIVNQNAQSYQQYGYPIEEIYDFYLDQLIDRELILNEARRLAAEGKAKQALVDSGELSELGSIVKDVTVAQNNDIWKAIYRQMESELNGVMLEISRDYSRDTIDPPPTIGQTTDPTPQYAVKIVKGAEEEEKERRANEKPWTPEQDATLVPGPADYLKLEAISRYVRKMADYFDKVKLSDVASPGKLSDRAAFDAAKELLNGKDGYYERAKKKAGVDEKGKTTGIAVFADLYADLIKPELFMVQYIYYRSMEESALIENLIEYVKDTVEITEDMVQKHFDTLLNTQKSMFSAANTASYLSALDSYRYGSSDLILFNPANVNQYYVKQILIPFSDAQKADLDAYKNSGKNTPAAIKAKREFMATQIMSYEHVNGFDVGSPKTVQSIYAEIKAVMTQYAGNSYEAEINFENLIYKYNADPGAFNNPVGYALRFENPSSQYVPEFQEGADKLYDDVRKGNALVGSLSEMIVTDYGVHILMYSSDLRAGELTLNSFTTVFRDETVYQYIKDLLKSKYEEQKYNSYVSSLLKDLRTNYEGEGKNQK
ncbi:MAG: peptidylprolyl isomerase, partial [Firmicutes bacterium]|nr:peptidylprolyl isomerase [Bacillota bacterium]